MHHLFFFFGAPCLNIEGSPSKSLLSQLISTVVVVHLTWVQTRFLRALAQWVLISLEWGNISYSISRALLKSRSLSSSSRKEKIIFAKGGDIRIQIKKDIKRGALSWDHDEQKHVEGKKIIFLAPVNTPLNNFPNNNNNNNNKSFSR